MAATTVSSAAPDPKLVTTDLHPDASPPTSLFDRPNWDAFTVSVDGRPSGVRLEQTGPRRFQLHCDVHYAGPLGLDHLGLDDEAEACLRAVGPATLPDTDLASVPAPFRWWTNTYGIHSPAALIHDRFIGEPADGDPGRPEGVSEAHIDRYFRFMLQASGVPFFRRWLMWAAVAARTRSKTSLSGLLSMLVWTVATGVAWTMIVLAVLQGRPWTAVGILALLVPLSGLWGKQFGAGLMMAYVGVPCLLPPSVVSVPFLAVYVLFEAVGKQLGRSYRYLSTDAESMEAS